MVKIFKIVSSVLMIAVGLSSCSIRESKGYSGGKDATVIKISPFMAGIISQKKQLRQNGIRLSGLEIITSENPALDDSFAAKIDEYINEMKMENVLETRDNEDIVDIYAHPIPDKEGKADAMVIKIREPKGLTIMKMRGKFDFAKMIKNLEEQKEEGKELDLGIIKR